MSTHTVASTDELEEGDRMLVRLEGREIAVFRIEGELYAYTNWCAHQSGPICEGPLSGTQEARFNPSTLETEVEWVREGRILNCPWHGWEYDVTNGECLSSDSNDVALISHPVRVEDDEIVVEL